MVNSGFHRLKTNNNGNMMVIWLVVWNMNFIFPHILGIIIPTDELIFFRGVETTNQNCIVMLFMVWYMYSDGI